jgi:HD-like signal output (HDOD) protein
MAAVLPTHAAPTRRFGRFELKLLVGKSLATNTWLAFDGGLKSDVLLCVPRVQPANAAERDNWTQDVLLVSKLKHPRLHEMVDMGVHEGWPFTVHERGNFLTLAEHLQPGHGGLNLQETVGLLVDILDGLAYAHEAGVAHRDLALHNILIDGSGRAKLIGLSVGIAATVPGSAATAMSRHEQRASAERDILMAGLVLHRLLAGHAALDDNDFGHAVERVGPEIVRLPWTTPQSVPETLRAIVNRATDRQQRQRYLSARTLLAALQGWVKTNSQESAGPLALLLDRLSSVGHLPSRASDMSSIQRLLTNDGLRVDGMVDQLINDPAICWELLKVINTVRYQAGSDDTVTSLSRTIVLLGQQGLRKVCGGVRTWPGVLHVAASKADRPGVASPAEALEHELKMACAAAHTARWLRPFNIGDEEVMVAAMSQRLGRLLLMYHYPDESSQIARLMQAGPPPEPGDKPTPGMNYAAAVGAVLGINPDELTGAVLRHWGLGESLIQAAKPYGDTAPRHPENPDDWLRLIAGLSNELCNLIGRPQKQQMVLLTQILARYARPAQVAQKEMQEALKRALGSVDTQWQQQVFPNLQMMV